MRWLGLIVRVLEVNGLQPVFFWLPKDRVHLRNILVKLRRLDIFSFQYLDPSHEFMKFVVRKLFGQAVDLRVPRIDYVESARLRVEPEFRGKKRSMVPGTFWRPVTMALLVKMGTGLKHGSALTWG
jgi:hypothetical protein